MTRPRANPGPPSSFSRHWEERIPRIVVPRKNCCFSLLDVRHRSLSLSLAQRSQFHSVFRCERSRAHCSARVLTHTHARTPLPHFFLRWEQQQIYIYIANLSALCQFFGGQICKGDFVVVNVVILLLLLCVKSCRRWW